MTGLENVIRQLENRKAAIERALAALREVGDVPVPTLVKPATQKSAPATNRRSEGQKKRWAAKQQAQVSPAPAPRKARISPEGRKRLADAMKKRWAVKRSAAQARKAGPKKAA